MNNELFLNIGIIVHSRLSWIILLPPLIGEEKFMVLPSGTNGSWCCSFQQPIPAHKLWKEIIYNHGLKKSTTSRYHQQTIEPSRESHAHPPRIPNPSPPPQTPQPLPRKKTQPFSSPRNKSYCHFLGNKKASL